MYSLAIEQIDIGVVLINQNRKVVIWNHWLETTSGISEEAALGKEISELFPGKIKGRLLQTIDYALKQHLSSVLSSSLNRYVLPLYKPSSGNPESSMAVAQSIVVKPSIDERGDCYCLIHINDVTDVIKREALLKQRGADLKRLAHDKAISELRVRSVIENTLDSILTFDSCGLIISYNPATARLFGFVEQDINERYLQNLICELSQHASVPIDGIIESLGFTGCDAEERWPEAEGLRFGEEIFPIEIAVTTIETEGNMLFTAVIRDLSERKKSEERLTKLAQNDSLTGLANRSLFYSRLEHLIIRTKRSQKWSALLLIDLDRFKIINDTMGHDVGDKVLQYVAEKLTDCVRLVDLVARLGGDEFAVLLEESGSESEVEDVVSRISEALSTTIGISGYDVEISSSIGVAMLDNKVLDSEKLIKNADIAMYYAKERGRNNFKFYTHHLRQITEVKLNLENSLHRALNNNEFILYYQPQFDMKINKIVGGEALLRWRHPDLGLVSPDSFIPLLEETGFIKQVGEWVLNEACLQCKEWIQKGIVSDDFTVAVNFSARQIKNIETANLIVNTLAKVGLNSRNLDVELTESSLMEGHRNPNEVLAELKRTGVSISIDDFGTGYSSLSYLKQFPIDNLKIDRSFVDDINECKESAAIVNTIIALAKNLGLTVIAEGVEDQTTFDYLALHDCNVAQGFLMARPMCVQDFEAFVMKYSEKVLRKAAPI